MSIVSSDSYLPRLTTCRFAPVNLNKHDGGEEYSKVVEALAADDKARTAFLKACLLKLSLDINEHEQSVPSLSRLHLSSQHASDVSELVSSWADAISHDDGEEYIKAENDTFHLEKPSRWSMGALDRAVDAVASVLGGVVSSKADDERDGGGDRIVLDYNKVVKRLVAHEIDMPSNKETPNFNHHAYFANLRHYHTKTRGIEGNFGKYLMYGEVVTSTNTLLEKFVKPSSPDITPAKRRQKSETLESPPFGFYSIRNDSNRWAWPRHQRLGIPSRRPHLQCTVTASDAVDTVRTSRICPISCRSSGDHRHTYV